ncbi:IPT/TIG domain-containing protein [Actinoplanes friuliensis]|uniref:Outer membrane autotransporter barrel domain-containing protein n=1 Tax=Actinoplanes friuliensis DSM 7358 TaxID=1246995 RepID=U5W801_9ACTN|nr:IPT/TIG domain-containing protein [Actinoplanes friuliensis]AGZ45137.1 outer membrane autotransporter barrel domain-containing protein [Actinoplanes friuliensis DSM 7358]
MRMKSRVLSRRWIAVAAVVVTAIPATAFATLPSGPEALPHAVGGVIQSTVRVTAKPATGGVHANEVLPTSVDLRQYAPAVGDQGQIGACVAWTIGYSIMGYWANRTSGVGAPYAPLFLYMRNVAKGGAPSAGLNPDSVLANAASGGVDTQANYWQGTANWQAAPTQAEIDNAKNYRVGNWSRLFAGANQGAGAQTAIMQTLASGSPVALAIPVYKDFMYLRSHNLYTTVSGTNLGGHMIAVYGYDAQGVYIRNSWGSVWGNSGDAHVAWSFITKAATGGYAVNGISTPASPIPLLPTVGALSTVKAPAGTSVTITGAGLSSATSVRFGGDEATFTQQTVGGLTKLVAVAPPHADGVVDITVTNPTGTSVASSTSKFTYVPPAPGITTLNPGTVVTLGGTTVTLTGRDLTGVTSVKVGTTAVPAKAVTPTSLSFVAPARTAGTVPVTVTNTYGTSTPAGQLTYALPPAPAVSSIEPGSGLTYKRTAVVVTGTDLAGTTKVTLGGTPVSFQKVSGTQLKLTLPAGTAGARTLQITTPGGSSTATEDSTFTYLTPPVPAITGVTPSSGLTYLRTPVVITGENFTDSTKLTLDGVALSYTKVSSTQIKATLPVHAAGAAGLQLTTPGGTSATGSAAQFTYTAPPAPAITSLSVTSTMTRTSTPLLITGTGLTGATRLTVGGTSTTFTKVSDTQLKLTLPARTTAGAAPIVVTTPGGTSAPMPFTFLPRP